MSPRLLILILFFSYPFGTIGNGASSRMKVTRYTYLLTLNDRKRHEHVIEQGRVIRFMVQFETFVEGKWLPVIRYDTAHGFPHVDRTLPDGTIEKIPLLTKDLGEALTFADQDIDENRQRYKEVYLKERRQ